MAVQIDLGSGRQQLLCCHSAFPSIKEAEKTRAHGKGSINPIVQSVDELQIQVLNISSTDHQGWVKQSKNSGMATSPISLLCLSESNVASRVWSHAGLTVATSLSVAAKGGTDLPTTKGCYENADSQEQGSRASSHTGGNQGSPLLRF